MEDCKRKTKTFGTIEGVPVGKRFENFYEMDKCRMHLKPNNNVSYSKEGVYSVEIRSMDTDNGDKIRLIRSFDHNHKKRSLQVRPDSIVVLSEAFEKNFKDGTPIRVIRSAAAGGQYAPLVGYRYDGLYKVTNITETVGVEDPISKRTCGQWKCDLELLPGQPIFWEKPPADA